MRPNTLLTYNPQKPAPEHAIYILSRGRNAGRPMMEPCPNCYVYKTYNSYDTEIRYWTHYALWKNGFFHQYLSGSVIKMLRLSDLRQLHRTWILDFINKGFQNPSLIEKIRNTWQLEQKLEEQTKTLRQLRAALVQKHYLTR